VCLECKGTSNKAYFGCKIVEEDGTVDLYTRKRDDADGPLVVFAFQDQVFYSDNVQG
jgi:hypothetical protein